MTGRVGIVGVGYEGFRPAITDLSTRELMFQAASKAYVDAGVDPRKDIGSFICCTEDLWEGWSIADEMVPDQIGGARKPVCTVPADGVTGIGHAVMHIRAGIADVVAVEAHSKVADVLDKQAVENLALDPAYLRVPGANNDLLAGLEMSGFMKRAGVSRDELSGLVATEKAAAIRNPRASYGLALSPSQVSAAEPISLPLRKYDKSAFAEAGVVAVVASERWIRKRKKEAVFVDGIAWRSSTPWHEGGPVAIARYAKDAFAGAAKQARLKSMTSIDFFEVDDTYSYKLMQHILSMGITKAGAIRLAKAGRLNPSGGSLGIGNLIEATGLRQVLECVMQLRGEAGKNQVRGARRGAVVSWRGNPTATGAAAVLSR
ncbi:MAG: acetyl-CoA acetyltransferase [Nitrososphaerota archaeon]|nr:acetyl-CoA acetyltransferase [Nitrososphaerota archaeon]